MSTPLERLRTSPAIDGLALTLSFAGWVGYATFARRRAEVEPSRLATTNRERGRWMMQAALRENRVVDGVAVQNLSASPSFFASTTILIIGGLRAVRSTTERASEFVREIPFAARTALLVFDLEMVRLTAIFGFAFFRFSRSLRRYSFGALLGAAAPGREGFADAASRSLRRTRRPRDGHGRAVAQRRVAGLPAVRRRHGVVLLALAFIAATAGVIVVLYRHEFRRDVLAVLRDG